jgi:prevent-host-death family protein
MNEISPSTAASVGAYEAKTRLSELLDRVENGEQIIITRHGRPVARLVPERAADRTAPRAAIARLVALGEKLTARGVNLSDGEIRALREVGRR